MNIYIHYITIMFGLYILFYNFVIIKVSRIVSEEPNDTYLLYVKFIWFLADCLDISKSFQQIARLSDIFYITLEQ